MSRDFPTACPTEIRSLDDAKTFFRFLYLVEKLAFHPDERFANYVDENGKRLYAAAKARELDRLMAQTFEVCDDPYAVAVEIAEFHDVY